MGQSPASGGKLTGDCIVSDPARAVGQHLERACSTLPTPCGGP